METIGVVTTIRRVHNWTKVHSFLAMHQHSVASCEVLPCVTKLYSQTQKTGQGKEKLCSPLRKYVLLFFLFVKRLSSSRNPVTTAASKLTSSTAAIQSSSSSWYFSLVFIQVA